MRGLLTILAVASAAEAAVLEARQTMTPQYFQTVPEFYPGPTPTGVPGFLAQTNPAPFPGVTYVPPQPLETQVPISGQPAGGNIFQLMGQLSHYFPNPIGLGVDEYPLPAGAQIVQLNMLSRHGARYPTAPLSTVAKLQSNPFKARGKLAFLNTWTYKLGEQILVPVGKQELFDSGTLHQYLYGHLYPNDGSKIIARTTSEDRMLKSGEYFLTGFFGIGWTSNATLEVIIEEDGFKNSLAGYDYCTNANTFVSTGGTNASERWYNIYLGDATKRLNRDIDFGNGITLNATDAYNMQSLCAYETVALGYSSFCDLFTYKEWEGYEYSVDISFAGNDAFQSPTGRAVGIGWVQELRARLTHHYVRSHGGSANITLDSMPSTFPLNQTLNFDFSHDTNIMSILTAMGITQFSGYLPDTHMIPHNLTVSHLEPFGARLDIEVIDSPQPVPADRSTDLETSGPPTTYVHFLLNQRTLPLGFSFSECGQRADGWCEIGDFLQATSTAYMESDYHHACFGDYPAVPYGKIKNGAPIS